MWSVISESKEKVDEEGFWSAVQVLVDRSHIVNRRLMGVEALHSWIITAPETDGLQTGNSWNSNCMALMEILCLCTSKEVEIKEIIGNAGLSVNPCSNVWKDIKKDVVVQQRTLLPKQPEKFQPVTEIVILDRADRAVVFYPFDIPKDGLLLIPHCTYKLALRRGRIILAVMIDSEDGGQVDMSHPSIQWLQSHTFRKVINWAAESSSKQTMASLSLIPISRYSKNYHRLKATYGPPLIQMWPESTDPLKFVYEDICIAAYLMTLWELEQERLQLGRKQSFVDMGCGNGLLVYILASEGYLGFGVDIRKRKIWDLYGPETKLKEMVITPSDRMLFPEYDWLVGNHSDELTPWIPVIAARSSYRMGVFLLPCCPYTFNGKYQRTHSGTSHYQDYLVFIQELCQVMGFHVEQDKLRIPSTKRICFVCTSRTYQPDEEPIIDQQRTEYILSASVKPAQKSKVHHTSVPTTNNIKSQSISNGRTKSCETSENFSADKNKWIGNFNPREKVEKVQNCSQLDPKYLDKVVTKIATKLLETEDNFVPIADEEQVIKMWNSGGTLAISELAEFLDAESLYQLKNQCGGLQTLLYNHRNIFTVEKGKVSLTIPSKNQDGRTDKKSKNRKQRPMRLKIKQCWFFNHHPQGCPLQSIECTYIHGNENNSS